MTVSLPDDDNAQDDSVLCATIPEHLAGKRLDAVCAQLFDQFSRSRLSQWIDEGRLRVDGEVQTRGRQPAMAGSELVLDAEPQADLRVIAQDIPLDIVYADEDLAIVDKPAGLTTHPGAGQADGTLQNALLYRFGQTAVVPRAGIVHRLDKDTSGLLVVALNLSAHAHLAAQIADRDVEREYDTLIQGEMISGGSIDAPIGRHPRDRLKMAVVERGGREAITHYRVTERFNNYTRLAVRLQTGRTHQIRVHLSHLRYPIVGDPLYGTPPRCSGMDEALRTALQSFGRQALHARSLAITHPRSGERMQWTREAPADMQTLFALLRTHAPRG